MYITQLTIATSFVIVEYCEDNSRERLAENVVGISLSLYLKYHALLYMIPFYV